MPRKFQENLKFTWKTNTHKHTYVHMNRVMGEIYNRVHQNKITKISKRKYLIKHLKEAAVKLTLAMKMIK